jgi:hypothetical protein
MNGATKLKDGIVEEEVVGLGEGAEKRRYLGQWQG